MALVEPSFKLSRNWSPYSLSKCLSQRICDRHQRGKGVPSPFAREKRVYSADSGGKVFSGSGATLELLLPAYGRVAPFPSKLSIGRVQHQMQLQSLSLEPLR